MSIRPTVYYHLQAVEKECRGLTFPAFTIATSRYKNVVEAEACAYSILAAVEAIFNGLGKCMMHRRALVLGSRGNIGGFLMKIMAGRVSYGSAWGLDIKGAQPGNEGIREFSHMDQMTKEDWEHLDLFLGVTGVSVLKKDFFKKLILEGSATELFFASGSTKTVEFASLTEWIEELSARDRPTNRRTSRPLGETPHQGPSKPDSTRSSRAHCF